MIHVMVKIFFFSIFWNEKRKITARKVQFEQSWLVLAWRTVPETRCEARVIKVVFELQRSMVRRDEKSDSGLFCFFF